MMKKVVVNFMTLLLLIMGATSCSSDNAAPMDKITTADMEAIRTAVKTGAWRISYYFDTDKEETSNFNGFVFTFNSSGVIGATDGNTALSGAWSVSSSDNSTADVSDDTVDLSISFASPANFLEISDDWEVISYSNNKIELKDVSGGNGGTDLLTFEKI